MFPGIDFDVFCYIEDSPFLIGPLEDFCRKTGFTQLTESKEVVHVLQKLDTSCSFRQHRATH